MLKGLLWVEDFSIPTWLALGASFHILLVTFLPFRLSILLPFSWLLYRLCQSIISTRGIFKTSFTELNRGRWVGNIPDAAGEDTNGVVCFVLGARLNHSFGKLGPGNAEVGKLFQEMWVEAEKNRKEWGYIGRTGTLIDNSGGATALITISYWKDMKALQAFSATSVHRLAQNGYNFGRFPYIGILHETWYAPKGSWETIYGAFPAWGFGSGKFATKDESGDLKLIDTLARKPKISSMMARMKSST